jgi:hypothetical protein
VHGHKSPGGTTVRCRGMELGFSSARG